jgi:hypothetical protein
MPAGTLTRFRYLRNSHDAAEKSLTVAARRNEDAGTGRASYSLTLVFCPVASTSSGEAARRKKSISSLPHETNVRPSDEKITQ